MAVELFANLAETTLASGYTSGGASISVVSAAGFPTTGIFRVRLGNAGRTVFRVDSVAGTMFTGGAEFNDANASSGATATLVITRASLERLLQSPDLVSALVYARAGVGAGDYYGLVNKMLPPSAAALAWVNQGAATIDESLGPTLITVPSQTTNTRMRTKAAPATPYTVTTAFKYRAAFFDTNRYGGLLFRESGTGKLHFWQFTNSLFQLVNFTNPSTFFSNPLNGQSLGVIAAETLIWGQIKDDGANLHFSWSLDGLYFVEVGTVGRTSFMAGGPDQYGIFGNVDSNGGEFDVLFYSLIQT